jgi:hypothetical protein
MGGILAEVTMRIGAVDMISDIIRGPGRKRVVGIVTLASCFAGGAYLLSTATYYLQHWSQTELYNGRVAVVGGILVAVIACIKTA